MHKLRVTAGFMRGECTNGGEKKLLFDLSTSVFDTNDEVIGTFAAVVKGCHDNHEKKIEVHMTCQECG